MHASSFSLLLSSQPSALGLLASPLLEGTISAPSRAQVLSEIGPSSVRDAARRCFPYPCRSRYTALSMVPRPPSLLQRLAALAARPLALLGLVPADPLALPYLPPGVDPAVAAELLQRGGSLGLEAAASLGGAELGSPGKGIRTSGGYPLSPGRVGGGPVAAGPPRGGGWGSGAGQAGGAAPSTSTVLAAGAVVAAVAATAALFFMRRA